MQLVHSVCSRMPLEAVVWLGGLLVLALLDPSVEHGSICPFQYLGPGYCPGCGLGRSVSFLLHGDLFASWAAHPLGVPAVAILLGRSCLLLFRRRRYPPVIHHTA